MFLAFSDNLSSFYLALFNEKYNNRTNTTFCLPLIFLRADEKGIKSSRVQLQCIVIALGLYENTICKNLHLNPYANGQHCNFLYCSKREYKMLCKLHNQTVACKSMALREMQNSKENTDCFKM